MLTFRESCSSPYQDEEQPDTSSWWSEL